MYSGLVLLEGVKGVQPWRSWRYKDADNCDGHGAKKNSGNEGNRSTDEVCFWNSGARWSERAASEPDRGPVQPLYPHIRPAKTKKRGWLARGNAIRGGWQGSNRMHEVALWVKWLSLGTQDLPAAILLLLSIAIAIRIAYLERENDPVLRQWTLVDRRTVNRSICKRLDLWAASAAPKIQADFASSSLEVAHGSRPCSLSGTDSLQVRLTGSRWAVRKGLLPSPRKMMCVTPSGWFVLHSGRGTARLGCNREETPTIRRGIIKARTSELNRCTRLSVPRAVWPGSSFKTCEVFDNELLSFSSSVLLGFVRLRAHFPPRRYDSRCVSILYRRYIDPTVLENRSLSFPTIRYIFTFLPLA